MMADVPIIVLAGLGTYLLRLGPMLGAHRLARLGPRAQAALAALGPAAIAALLATSIGPQAISGDPAQTEPLILALGAIIGARQVFGGIAAPTLAGVLGYALCLTWMS